MLKDFDIAFTNKIKAYWSNTIYANTAIVYNVAYNLVEDPTVQLKFPLISIYRPTGFELAPHQNFAARKRGLTLYYNESTGKAINVRYVIANLPYQIDIYAKSPEVLDDMTEELIQALSLDSKLEVSQYDSENNVYFTDTYDITYSAGPNEQSEFQNDDRVYHYSLLYNINNAYLINFKPETLVSDVDIGLEQVNEVIDKEDN